MSSVGRFTVQIDLADPSWWHEDGTLKRQALQDELARLSYGILEGRSNITRDTYKDETIPMTAAAPSGKSVGEASLTLFGSDGPLNVAYGKRHPR